MEWREVQEHVVVPDSGWVEIERKRIEAAANPGIWVIATTFYAPEIDLFAALQQDATRLTFAHLKNGSALVRYEFAGAAAADQGRRRMGPMMMCSTTARPPRLVR